jgi:hypothetical protein
VLFLLLGSGSLATDLTVGRAPRPIDSITFLGRFIFGSHLGSLRAVPNKGKAEVFAVATLTGPEAGG